MSLDPNRPDGKAQRGSDGKFLPGCKGGPGRKPVESERRYLITLGERLSIDRWASIIDRAIDEAEAGSESAREWLSKWALGKPGSLSLEDLLRVRQGSPTARSVLEDLLSHPDPEKRLRAAQALLEHEAGADRMDKFLAAVRDQSGQEHSIVRPEGPNPWQPEGED